jgi:hypothetical protein
MRKILAVLVVSGALAATAAPVLANWVCGPQGCYIMTRIGR